MGTFVVHREEGERDTHWVPSEDHGEESAAVRRKDVENTWGGRRTGGRWNSVGDDLHREAEVNCGTVGGATSTI